MYELKRPNFIPVLYSAGICGRVSYDILYLVLTRFLPALVARYVVTTKSKAKAKAKSKPKSKSGLVPNLVPGTSEACSSSLKLWKPALFQRFPVINLVLALIWFWLWVCLCLCLWFCSHNISRTRCTLQQVLYYFWSCSHDYRATAVVRATAWSIPKLINTFRLLKKETRRKTK